jgi:hypothetical protein
MITEEEINAEIKRLSEIIEIEEERRKIIDPIIARCKENSEKLRRIFFMFDTKVGE